MNDLTFFLTGLFIGMMIEAYMLRSIFKSESDKTDYLGKVICQLTKENENLRDYWKMNDDGEEWKNT